MSLSSLRLPVCALLLLAGCGPEPTPFSDFGSSSHDTAPPSAAGQALWGASVTQVAPGVAAVADTRDDSVQLVDATTGATDAVRFPRGSRPSRIAPVEPDEFLVVLRGSGQVARVRRGSVRETSDVCAEPRGVAWDAVERRVLVACAGGELVSLSSAGRQVMNVGEELRDVLVVGRAVWVTTFRTAELLELDSGGAVVTRLSPPKHAVTRTTARGPTALTFTPRLAWRTVVSGDHVVMAHQEHLDDDVVLLTSTPGTLPTTPPPYYGTGASCGTTVASSALTIFDLSRRTVESSTAVPGALPLDVSTDGTFIAVTTTGNGGVVLAPWSLVTGSSCLAAAPYVTTPSPVGVGFVDGAVAVLDQDGTVLLPGGRSPVVSLRSPKTPLERPEALFHQQSPSGVACASCHAEGFDDGHTWRFEGGTVRTQALAGGLTKTAPFHWRGELRDLRAVLHTTFEQRMGGVLDPSLSTYALGQWLDSIPARAGDTGDVRAGQAVFDRAGCASCHAGAAFTDNATVDVGTGDRFQVPSLRGVKWHGPWMHDGCAQTLEQRFDPACGGTKHGDVSPADVPDLVAYLKSL